MGPKESKFQKRNQSEIIVRPNTRKIEINKEPEKQKPVEIDKSKEVSGTLWEDIRKIYKFKDVIGGGHFGTVRKSYKKGENPRVYYAIKSLPKKTVSLEDLKNLEKEVDILSSLDHPNIVKFFESYQDKHYFHIVMELCNGKEVFEKINEDGKMTEIKVREIIYKVISAINYCHNIGVSHRDIKPENILYNQTDNEIKLIDFGLSRKYIVKEKMHTILGTPFYVAPEVLNGEYDEKCDVWSIGAIGYIMLSGEPPFVGANNQEIFRKIVRDQPSFSKEKFPNVSDIAIDFLKKCLVKKPENRISIKQAYDHEWFKIIEEEIYSSDKVNPKILQNIKGYHNPNKFKRLVLKYIINTMSKSEIKKLNEAFIAIDTKKIGYINSEQLEEAFRRADINIDKEEILKIFDNEKKNDKMEYSEFIVASLNQGAVLNKTSLTKSFLNFDFDKNGYIDAQDLKLVLLRNGKKDINVEELENIIKEASNTKDNKISLEEFIQLFSVDEI